MKTGKQNTLHPQTGFADCLRSFPHYKPAFEKLGFDCDATSGQSLASICAKHQLDPDTVVRVLLACDEKLAASQAQPIELLPLDRLCDHLESLHTRCLEVLDRFEQTVCEADKHPTQNGSLLPLIQARLTQFREGVTQHLQEERKVFFPLIRQLDNTTMIGPTAFEQLKDPLAEMRQQHSEMEEALAELEMLIDDYTQSSNPPRHPGLHDCLRDLQETLQSQIYQENQILFRRVLA